MQRIDVVAVALIDSDDRVLVAQRPPGKPLAGLWEFPGGKIETGERPATALVRELAEELGIRVAEADLHPLTFVAHAYPDFQLLMLLYTCTRWTGEPVGDEGQPVAWHMVDALAALAMPPADVPLLAPLQAFVAGK
jgi:8-oxo-dGTP diphosphatase